MMLFTETELLPLEEIAWQKSNLKTMYDEETKMHDPEISEENIKNAVMEIKEFDYTNVETAVIEMVKADLKPKKVLKKPAPVTCSICGRERDCRSMKATLVEDSALNQVRRYVCRKTVKAEDGSVKCFIKE